GEPGRIANLTTRPDMAPRNCSLNSRGLTQDISYAHLDAGGAHRRLRLCDRELAVVEDRRGENRVGAADRDAFDEMRKRPDAPRCNHRHLDGIDDLASQLEVEPLARAVAVHARQQDFAGAVPGYFAGPFDDIDAGGRSTAVDVHLPLVDR